MVKFARGYESKMRPRQLRRVEGALTASEMAAVRAPLDAAASLQVRIDASIAVATRERGSAIANCFVDKYGAARRQFVAFRGTDGRYGVRCEVCDVKQVLSEAMQKAQTLGPRRRALFLASSRLSISCPLLKKRKKKGHASLFSK